MHIATAIRIISRYRIHHKNPVLNTSTYVCSKFESKGRGWQGWRFDPCEEYCIDIGSVGKVF